MKNQTVINGSLLLTGFEQSIVFTISVNKYTGCSKREKKYYYFGLYTQYSFTYWFIWEVSLLIGTLAKIITNTSSAAVPEKDIKIPDFNCVSLMNNESLKKWTRHWQETLLTKGTWYLNINSEIKHPWFMNRKYIYRMFYTTICRLGIRHVSFSEHLLRKHMIFSTLCTYCNSSNQSLHYIFSPAQLYKPPENIPCSLPDA